MTTGNGRTRSQVEKFEARLNKKRADEIAIKEEELKNSSPEKVGEKIAKKHGISTEDIFAVITRQSMEPWLKMWNNSMEDVIRQTMRDEIKNIVRDVIQEEMQAAYRGIMKGLTQPAESEDIHSLVKDEISAIFNPSEMLVPEQKNDVACNLSETITPDIIENEKPMKNKGGRPRSQTDEEFYNELKQAVIEAHYMGVDPTKGKQFKQSGSRNNGLYQKYAKIHKGEKGSWAAHVESIIIELANEKA